MSGADARYFMLGALDLGLVNGQYAFLTINLDPASLQGRNTWQGDDGRDQDSLKAFSGIQYYNYLGQIYYDKIIMCMHRLTYTLYI